MFLCDGVKIIFRVGLVLLKSMLGTRDKLKACPCQYETMEVLRAIEPRYMQEGFLVLQVLELQVLAQDVEHEHRTQLKCWKKKRSEPSRKPPQRMHSACAIMATKAHTHQDLRQKPTIMVQYPSIPEEKFEPNLREEERNLKKNQALIPNPYALPGESNSTQILEIQPLNQENLNLVFPNPPSHPPQIPTMQENQVKRDEHFYRVTRASSSNSSINKKLAESIPLQHLSLLTAPVHESPSAWHPCLQECPPIQFREPDHDELPNNTENSATILDPSTDSNPLLTHNAPTTHDSPASPEYKNNALRNSRQRINSSEDTYL